MFAITINQGGLIGGIINREQLAFPAGTSHFVICETDFQTLEDLAKHIEDLSKQQNDSDITWRYRVGSHNVDAVRLKELLKAASINLTVLEAQELQGPATDVQP